MTFAPMAATGPEFFAFGCDWPLQAREQQEFLRGIPAVMWERNAVQAHFLRTFGSRVQSVEVTLRPGRGSRTYHIL